MPITARVPPGRAGRIWLRRRLATAYRGRDQLDRKLRILLPELGRQRIRAARCHDEWESACAQARRWTTRAALLSGQDTFRHAAVREPARVDLTWATSMGVSYPATVTLTAATAGPAGVADNAAVAPAIAATRAALLAGVQTAAADEAVRRIEAEIAVTRRRLHALDKRWLPWLTAALADLELALEQAEHEDGIRLRRASGRVTAARRSGPVPGPSEGRGAS